MNVVMSSMDNALLGSRNPNSSFVHIKRYRWHNERVKQVIPKDKLLVFNVKQGWKPLCEFLGRQVPEEPFPRANVGGEMVKGFVGDMFKKILLFIAFFVICAAVMVYFCKG
jgi:hypothetical protein